MRWITRERPRDRPDRLPPGSSLDSSIHPRVHLRAAGRSAGGSGEAGATPYDVEGVELSHDGPLCSFDAFLRNTGWTIQH